MNRNPTDKKLGLKPAAIDGLMRQRRGGRGKREASTKKALYEALHGQRSSVDTSSPVYSAFLSGQAVRGGPLHSDRVEQASRTLFSHSCWSLVSSAALKRAL
jgi:hypothetical protein